MEEQWQVDRARLWRLLQEQPDWSQRKLAQTTSRSVSWVKKWRKRLSQADPDDPDCLKSRSRRPKEAGSPIQAVVVERILAIRDNPPLNRVPGPLTIKYFLHEQEKEEPLGCYLPTSSSTIWRILDEHQRDLPTHSSRIRTAAAERTDGDLADRLQRHHHGASPGASSQATTFGGNVEYCGYRHLHPGR